MVKLFSTEHIFKHPWSNVTAAFWRKYPNEQAAHVRHCDTYERRIDQKTGNLITKRIIACKTAVPSWLAPFGAPDTAFAAETSVVNPKTKEMVITSQNITGSSFMVLEETCTYKQDKKQPNWTHYEQSAKITAFLPFISGKFENYSINNMHSKSHIGVGIIEDLCQQINTSGVLSLIDPLIEATKPLVNIETA